MAKFSARRGKLNAVPPAYATTIGRPLSLTGKMYDSVPGV